MQGCDWLYYDYTGDYEFQCGGAMFSAFIIFYIKVGWMKGRFVK